MADPVNSKLTFHPATALQSSHIGRFRSKTRIFFKKRADAEATKMGPDRLRNHPRSSWRSLVSANDRSPTQRISRT